MGRACNHCPFRKPYLGGLAPEYRIGACSLAMVVILKLLIGVLRDYLMSRGRLEAEVVVLRHQLNILRRQLPKRVRPNESGQTLQIGRSSSGSIDFYRISAMPSRSFVLKPSFAGIVWDFVRSGAGSLGIQAAGP